VNWRELYMINNAKFKGLLRYCPSLIIDLSSLFRVCLHAPVFSN
jgi:hypothetical protein